MQFRNNRSLYLFLLDWILGLLMEEGTVRLGASLRLRLPVAGRHIPLLVAHLQVAEDAVVLRAVSLLIELD